MENTYISKANTLDLDHIGWRSYNTIKKKAMEQEFSWSGLFISLSIAFFIVISSAFALEFLYDSVQIVQTEEIQPSARIIKLQGIPNYTVDHYVPLFDNYSRVEVFNTV